LYEVADKTPLIEGEFHTFCGLTEFIEEVGREWEILDEKFGYQEQQQ